ncbi:hypothetical protein [Bartonella sp. DGB2]|uniref:hypothetical protein n=1 Tax=Bartonella sp. DGB2 TaxID=3388426 RepID=UPI00399004BC
MEKKYELTDEIIGLQGRTLHRIKALRDFGDVKAGDLGGYIEREDNLSHEGECWVGNDARVFEYARIYGKAQVTGYALVFGSAKISGKARVYDDAQVFDHARIFGDARVFGDAKISDSAEVWGDAKIVDFAKVTNHAQIAASITIAGNDCINGFTRITTTSTTPA